VALYLLAGDWRGATAWAGIVVAASAVTAYSRHRARRGQEQQTHRNLLLRQGLIVLLVAAGSVLGGTLILVGVLGYGESTGWLLIVGGLCGVIAAAQMIRTAVNDDAFDRWKERYGRRLE
jgi:small neutral amino acid transporter SnatA (MarC family)